MTLPVYPSRTLLPGLAYSQKWSPSFFNQTATTATGADIDVGLAAYPLHDFELTYEFLRDSMNAPGNQSPNWLNGQGEEFRTMMGFHLMLGGTLGRFLYKNEADYQVFQNQIGVGDGTTTVFTVTRTFGANGYFQTEPVGQVNTGGDVPFNVYLNGSATPQLASAYTLSTSNPCANTITFGSAPPNGQKITVDMQYFYYCKLANNANTFEKFMHRLWLLDKVTLHSCRPGA
jgi:hypothetical protein